MSSTIERHFEGTPAELSFENTGTYIEVWREDINNYEDRGLSLTPEEAVLLRDFLNRQFPEGGSNA